MVIYIGRELLPEIRKIREDVFIKEQGFSVEFDDIDKNCFHLLISEGEKAVAAGRMYEKDGEYHIGRVSVAKPFRGKNYGKAAVEALENKAGELGGRHIAVSAQLQAKRFYEKMGYAAQGEEYLDEHCPHIDMYKDLERNS